MVTSSMIHVVERRRDRRLFTRDAKENKCSEQLSQGIRMMGSRCACALACCGIEKQKSIQDF